MTRFLALSALLILSCGFAVTAHATCNPPSNPGAVLCFPSTNSSPTSPVYFEGAARGANDSPIVKMILYADNVKEHEVDNYDTFSWTWVYPGHDDPLAFNGIHHLVLNAWDQNEHLFQYSEYIKETDAAVPQCSKPQTGFNLCSPFNGGYYPVGGINILTTGASNIVSYNVYLNGQFAFSSSGPNLEAISGTGEATSKPVKVTIVAQDSNKKSYTQNVNVYEYWASYVCGRSGCEPGIFGITPTENQVVSTTFNASAEVQYNTHTITAMKVYLDNTLVLTSSGPTIRGTVTGSPGTHLLTFQAWDTTGALYKYQETVEMEK
jgi:hypothetical protein